MANHKFFQLPRNLCPSIMSFTQQGGQQKALLLV